MNLLKGTSDFTKNFVCALFTMHRYIYRANVYSKNLPFLGALVR
jgi:hypothetical protein